MLRRVAFVRTYISEECSASIALMMEALRSTGTSALTRATRRNIPEDTILHSLRRENVQPYRCKINYFCLISIQRSSLANL
jgi:hypothetical protein